MKEIPLSRGLVALVDDDDYAELSQRTWNAMEVSPGKVYAGAATRRNGKPSYEYMHRALLNAQKGEYVDHVDGNGLNNTRENIRICTHAQNGSNRSGPQVNNTSGYLGVTKRKPDRWSAQVTHKNKVHYLGWFDCPIKAARARDKKARELHGQFAYINIREEI